MCEREEFRAPIEKRIPYPLVFSKPNVEREFVRFKEIFNNCISICPL